MIFFSTLLAISVVGADPAPSCLRHLTTTRSVTLSAYDTSHDKRGSNSISCNFNLTASEVADDLRAILDASTKNDCESLISISNDPLSIQFQDGRTDKLSRNEICRQQTRIRRFLCSHRGSISIDQLDLLGWRGAFLGSDEILINTVNDGSARPHLKIVAIGPI